MFDNKERKLERMSSGLPDTLSPGAYNAVMLLTLLYGFAVNALMVTALAAIGLNTSLLDFKKAGLKPMFYGITIDTLVTLTALAVIWGMGLL